jgi:hypothetical protein
MQALRAYTDDDMQRHHYPNHQNWDVSEVIHTPLLKFEIKGKGEVLIDQEEAGDLAVIFTRFATSGTVPIPEKQQPPQED